MSEMSIEHTHTAPHADEVHIPSKEQIENSKFATWLYLASEVVIFGSLMAVYAVFRLNHPEVVREIHDEVGILLVSLNTFLLLASSWAMVMGLRSIKQNDQQGLVRWIGLTALLGTVFVLLQYVEYNELGHLGISLGNEFGMRFYAPTAFHGAHVIVGVLWALRVISRGRRGIYNARNYLAVEIFGLYWHFVDVVWIILFTLIYLI
ncbi:MAG: cytochrome c oxidase subunit 3 [Anaerolineae bacterium]|nr:cytochrome c oxidase subunit 3 [Anaerolineae bacterium]